MVALTDCRPTASVMHLVLKPSSTTWPTTAHPTSHYLRQRRPAPNSQSERSDRNGDRDAAASQLGREAARPDRSISAIPVPISDASIIPFGRNHMCEESIMPISAFAMMPGGSELRNSPDRSPSATTDFTALT